MLKIADNKIADADKLKLRMFNEWAQFDQSIVDAAISQWRRRPCTRGTLSINSDNFEN